MWRAGDLRSLDWLSLRLLLRLLRRRRLLFVELRLHVRHWRRFGQRDVLRWWSRDIFWRLIDRCFDDRRRNVRKILNLFRRMNPGDYHGGKMDEDRAAKCCPDLPFRRALIKKWTGHTRYWLGPGIPDAALLLISNAIL